MIKMNNNHQKQNRPIIFLAISIALVLLGTWLFVSGIFRYSKGFFAFKQVSEIKWQEKKNIFPDTDSTSISEDQSISNIQIKELSETKSQEKNLYPVRPELGDKIGELYIPKLKAELPVYQGTEEDELEKGVGHFTKSVLPGETDNCVLSGHRNTVFRKLGEVGKGDTLIVRTSAGEFTYKVRKVRIVDKDDRTVIVPKPNATLTVTTCYPFNFIGSAPKRYILVAYLAKKVTNDLGK